MRYVAIIPARYASTRFPGKPLAPIGGRMMIERVYTAVSQAVESVWVATDDERIYRAVEGFGGRAVMTSASHRSGTDRVCEAYGKIGGAADVVINVQGDEPFIACGQLRAIMACFDDQSTQIATLVRPFDASRGYEALSNPNTPKVVVDSRGYALYFSRSVIPYVRGVREEEWAGRTQYYTHIGMYAYRAGTLAEITRLPQSPLELAESLEQLRWLEAGYRIRCGVTDIETIGIDTPADLERAEAFLRGDKP